MIQSNGNSVLAVEHLVKHYPVRGSEDVVHAVSDVSFTVHAGETLALVGESGSGKTTVGRCVLKLTKATSGRIVFTGEDVTYYSQERFRRLRPKIQLVFQEPSESLDPRMTVRQCIEENLILERRLDRLNREQRVLELLDMTGLSQTLLDHYPHELTGSEQQRVAIGRALSTNPELIVLDEPTSALDVGVRAEIILLLRRLQAETGVAYLFISHDLTAVREISHRVAVMYLGEIVEVSPNPDVFDHQLHPYAKALLSSVLLPDPRIPVGLTSLSGEIPSPVNLPTGCYLHPRCPYAIDMCSVDHPRLEAFGQDREAACWRAHEWAEAEVPDPTKATSG